MDMLLIDGELRLAGAQTVPAGHGEDARHTSVMRKESLKQQDDGAVVQDRLSYAWGSVEKPVGVKGVLRQCDRGYTDCR
jgi:hypothetical protein